MRLVLMTRDGRSQIDPETEEWSKREEDVK
jgi:hypothetical protein